MTSCEIKEMLAMTMPAPPSSKTRWVRSHPVLAAALIVMAAALGFGATILYYLSSFITLPIL